MLRVSSIGSAASELLAAGSAAIQGLRVTFFDHWEHPLDEALETLPETEVLPHELFRLLMKMSDPRLKRLALITEGGTPIAVAGLRNRRGSWEPVTQWIVPGVLFPVKPGYMARSLAALGLEIQVSWWRWEEPPESTRWITGVRSEPTYGMSCSQDFEAFWRKTDSFFKSIRNVRNRCKNYEFKINAPNAAEWTIRNWEARWRPEDCLEMPDLAERLLVAHYLERKGRHYTLSMFHDNEQVAGMTFLVHRNDVIAQINYRNPEYNRDGVMTRIMDLSFSWAREMGFGTVDLGGSHEYKEKWAPEYGRKWEFTVCPPSIRLRRKIARFVTKVLRRDD